MASSVSMLKKNTNEIQKDIENYRLTFLTRAMYLKGLLWKSSGGNNKNSRTSHKSCKYSERKGSITVVKFTELCQPVKLSQMKPEKVKLQVILNSRFSHSSSIHIISLHILFSISTSKSKNTDSRSDGGFVSGKYIASQGF